MAVPAASDAAVRLTYSECAQARRAGAQRRAVSEHARISGDTTDLANLSHPVLRTSHFYQFLWCVVMVVWVREGSS